MGARTLLERRGELDAIDGAINAVCRGDGRLLLVEGPAGIGKSALIDTAVDRAEARGINVLTARASASTSGLPFGIVRQLFDAELAGFAADQRRMLLSGAARPAEAVLAGDQAAVASGASSILHGLYWLCVNLVETSGALGLVVDDVQHADSASLRWLQFLAAQLDGWPVLLVAGRRLNDDGADRDLGPLVPDDARARIQPSPLSLGGVRALVHETLGEDAGEDLCVACHEVTAGSPFHVTELVASLRSAEPGPLDASALAQRSDDVSRTVLARLALLPAEATDMVQALAILDAEAVPGLVATLAGIAEDVVDDLVEALVEAHICVCSRTLRFVHPLVGAAVTATIAPKRSAHLHLQAALLLAEQEQTATRVAAHLLHVEPAGDQWAVTWLRRGAMRAARANTNDIAAAFLRRALAEPPAPGDLPSIMLELGLAECAAGVPGAVRRLEDAIDVATTPEERVRVALEAGLTLGLHGHGHDALSAFSRCREAMPKVADRDRVLDLEAGWLTASMLSRFDINRAPEHLAALTEEVAEPVTVAERLLLGALSWEGTTSNRVTADVGAVMARRAVGDGELFDTKSAERPALYVACTALSLSGDHAAAHRHLTTALETAERGRSLDGFAAASCWRAKVAVLRGALSAAQADARAGLAAADEGDAWGVGIAISLAMLMECLLTRGLVEEAGDALARWGDAAFRSESTMLSALLAMRGKYRVLTGARDLAVEDFRRCGQLFADAQITNPGVVPWRSSLARLLHAEGQVAEAAQLAAQELDLATSFGAPGAIGVALRASGILDEGIDGRALLKASVDVLEDAGQPLDLAKSLLSYGRRVHDEGDTMSARAPLRRALDLAHRGGAHTTAASARKALIAAGGRPRRQALFGVDALTPSERRIAVLAAEGLANREIAEQQFLTLRMVEVHLTRSYRKLGISSRTELAAALARASSER